MHGRAPEPDRNIPTNGGELGALMRAHDWSSSPLGPPSAWPQSLRTAVDLMVNSLFPMFIAWGPELAFLYNDGYRPIFGQKHPHALGRPFREVWAEIWPDIEPLVDKALAGETTFHEDLHLVMERHGYPEDTWYTFSYSPIRDESGRIAGLFCACTETTGRVLADRQRREAETALRESEDRFRNMADHAPVMVWTTDPSGYCTYLNKAWYDFTGQSQTEALGFGWLEATHPDDKELAAETFVTANAERAPFRIEYRLRHRDGSYRWAIDAASPRFGAGGEYLGYIGSVIDIDERKTIEAALSASEDHYRHAVELNPQVAWTALPDGQLDQVARRWLDWTGTTGLGASWGDAIHPDDLPPTVEAWTRSFTTGVPYDIEHRVRLLDGTYHWMRSRAFPRRDGEGRIVKWYGATEDIHERKTAEEHRVLLINELNHRVKNTLATVQSIARQTLRNAPSPEEASAALESRLVALSRAHDVLTRENWESVSLREIVALALSPYGNLGEGRLRAEGPPVRLPPRTALALAMALQELATNAAKYGALSNATGELHVGWTLEESDPPSLRLRWEERGGPTVAAPTRRGFGSRLIERSLGQDLGGAVAIVYAPTGVVCTVEAPLCQPQLLAFG
ncbi:MAG TPA: PAS domain S-box protein [Beijerinckiaceae bacterium]|jgi:PAS domain S-box-containing protein